MSNQSKKSGRIIRAPENFVDSKLAHDITVNGLSEERRGFLRKSFLAAGAAMASGTALAKAAGANGAEGDPNIMNLPEWATTLGKSVATNPYGMPSKYEANLQRRQSPGLTRVAQASVAFTPLQGLFGIITPSGLHFERHHQGWYDVDPTKHRFMINGMVKNPKVYTLVVLLCLPSVSRLFFFVCGPLSVLLEDCGFDKKNAKVVLAEGGDGSAMTRTISIDRALDDVIVAWGMNGEMLRPENGYPLRLVVPGVQGVSWVKWLRRIEVGDKPYAAKDEAVHYIDRMPDGNYRQYTSIQEAKSVITTPSAGQMLLDKGFNNITGLAWSGRGKIKRVDVSVDGGRNWRTARLEGPVLPKCLTRFNIDWVWDGSPVILQSRAIDETG